MQRRRFPAKEGASRHFGRNDIDLAIKYFNNFPIQAVKTGQYARLMLPSRSKMHRDRVVNPVPHILHWAYMLLILFYSLWVVPCKRRLNAMAVPPIIKRVPSHRMDIIGFTLTSTTSCSCA
jgi:hypothetical protein